MKIRLYVSNNSIIESGDIAPDFSSWSEHQTERKILKWISSLMKRDKSVLRGEIIKEG